MTTLFEGKRGSYGTFAASSAPYAMQDIFTISDCRLLSITIPVIKTGVSDTAGNFRLTLNVTGNSVEGLTTAPKRTYVIKVNGNEHNLNSNQSNVYRMIRVDLTEYDIVLAEDESLSFFSSADTLYPAYLGADNDNSNEAAVYLKQNFEQAMGYYNKVGVSSELSVSRGSFFFNFEWERTYENAAAYEAELAEEAEYQMMLAAVKDYYGGKYLSVLGDSISTFGGISNDTTINATLGNNEIWYTLSSSNFYDYTDTYWGRLLTDANMKLCVNNGWSGSRVYGRSNWNYRDNMLTRSTQLQRTDGTTPDLILVYMGINDLHNNDDVLFGDLYAILNDSADQRSDSEKIDAWIAGVITQADSLGGYVAAGITYKTWEQAYALSLRAMRNKYADADIVCLTMVPNNHGKFSAEKLNQYNRCITALAAYFGVTVVDQSSIMTQETCHGYTIDGNGTSLHPTSYGHARMERLIVETLYREIVTQAQS